MITNKQYDVLKNVAQIWLPAAGTLYFTLAQVWHLPSAEQVTASVVAFDTFLGVLLGLSTTAYNKSDEKFQGDLNVITDEEGFKKFRMEFNNDPRSFEDMEHVAFKVKKSNAPAEGVAA